ncbi:hypothetical protein C8J56DRAFT_1062166 [Mycena floridula]|nr:hypothetical protein C8J56DRAFT_1062166 [Mycena floridula]
MAPQAMPNSLSPLQPSHPFQVLVQPLFQFHVVFDEASEMIQQEHVDPKAHCWCGVPELRTSTSPALNTKYLVRRILGLWIRILALGLSVVDLSSTCTSNSLDVSPPSSPSSPIALSTGGLEIYEKCPAERGQDQQTTWAVTFSEAYTAIIFLTAQASTSSHHFLRQQLWIVKVSLAMFSLSSTIILLLALLPCFTGARWSKAPKT